MADEGTYWVRRHPSVTPDEAYIEEEALSEFSAAPAEAFVKIGGGGLEPRMAREYSTLLGETIFVAAHDSSEYFRVEVWRGGTPLRRLLYTQDAGWEEVAGDEQPWEVPLFFSEARLADHRRTHGAHDGEAIEEAWRRRALRTGDRWPMIVAVLLAADLRERLGLPG